MSTRVTVCEYLSSARNEKMHALAPAIDAHRADACSMVTFYDDVVEHQAKYKAHYRGPLPAWPNLIGRQALATYANVLPSASRALSQDVRNVGHRACVAGIVFGMMLASMVSAPSRPLYWAIVVSTTCLAYEGARVRFRRAHAHDTDRLMQLLTLSCLAVRAYLGEFGAAPPFDSNDARLDSVSRLCLQNLSRNIDPVCHEAFVQYTNWAQTYRRPNAVAAPLPPTLKAGQAQF